MSRTSHKHEIDVGSDSHIIHEEAQWCFAGNEPRQEPRDAWEKPLKAPPGHHNMLAHHRRLWSSADGKRGSMAVPRPQQFEELQLDWAYKKIFTKLLKNYFSPLSALKSIMISEWVYLDY